MGHGWIITISAQKLWGVYESEIMKNIERHFFLLFIYLI